MLERGLRAGWAPRVVLLGAKSAEDPTSAALVAALAGRGVEHHFVSDAALLEVAEGRNAGLVTALFDVPVLPALDSLVARQAGPALFLALVDVEEPGNVGALIRTALASGAAGVVCTGVTDPFHPKAVRTSLGSVFKLPIARLAPGVEPVPALQDAGLYCLAAVARDGEPIDRASWPRAKLAVLLGNEGRGLSERARDTADARVSIDLSTAADSYCVNAAAAIFAYEVQRRLRAGP